MSVNTSDVSGGAEKISLELHRIMRSRGVESTLAVGWKNTDEPGVVEIPNRANRSVWARTVGRSQKAGTIATLSRAFAEPARYAKRIAGREDFDFPASMTIDALAPRKPQIIQFHNLHGGYFDIRALPSLTHRYESILSPHDPWPFTGHCAHPFECTRWLTGCGECPDIGRFVPIVRDASDINWRVKHEALRRSRLRISSPSRWLLNIAQAAGLGDAVIETRVIPNGIDTSVFRLGDRAQARSSLGLDSHGLIFVTSARANTANDFKGFDVLREALETLSHHMPGDDEILILTLGDTAPSRRIGRFNLKSVLFNRDPGVIASYLRAADLYILPSRAENYPLAILEALACGLPVVASDTGGVPEVVAGSNAALLFPNGDSAALALRLESLIVAGDLLKNLAANAREHSAHCFSIEEQATAYLSWYEEILESR